MIFLSNYTTTKAVSGIVSGNSFPYYEYWNTCNICSVHRTEKTWRMNFEYNLKSPSKNWKYPKPVFSVFRKYGSTKLKHEWQFFFLALISPSSNLLNVTPSPTPTLLFLLQLFIWSDNFSLILSSTTIFPKSRQFHQLSFFHKQLSHCLFRKSPPFNLGITFNIQNYQLVI